jgi:hypothetical protein
MDDLEALRRLGTDVPDEDSDARERARRRLQERYSKAASPPLSRSRTRTLRWWGAVAAAVAAILAAQALLPRGTGGPITSAAGTLRRLALVAAEQRHPALRAGQYVYVRSELLQRVSGEDLGTGASWTALVRVSQQDWRASDGSGRILKVAGMPRFLTPGDERAWHRAGEPPLIAPRADDRYPAGTFPTQDLSGLPLDPGVLREVIERRSVIGGAPGEAETFAIVGRLLAEDRASPRLRASLFQVAASLPGVTLVGGTTDPVGRPCIAVALSGPTDRIVLDFDARTSALLAREQFRSRPGGPVERTGWQAYWPPRVVGSIDSAAPGR